MEEKKGGKGLLVFVVVLILGLLGAVGGAYAMGYISLDMFKLKTPIDKVFVAYEKMDENKKQSAEVEYSLKADKEGLAKAVKEVLNDVKIPITSTEEQISDFLSDIIEKFSINYAVLFDKDNIKMGSLLDFKYNGETLADVTALVKPYLFKVGSNLLPKTVVLKMSDNFPNIEKVDFKPYVDIWHEKDAYLNDFMKKGEYIQLIRDTMNPNAKEENDKITFSLTSTKLGEMVRGLAKTAKTDEKLKLAIKNKFEKTVSHLRKSKDYERFGMTDNDLEKMEKELLDNFDKKYVEVLEVYEKLDYKNEQETQNAFTFYLKDGVLDGMTGEVSVNGVTFVAKVVYGTSTHFDEVDKADTPMNLMEVYGLMPEIMKKADNLLKEGGFKKLIDDIRETANAKLNTDDSTNIGFFLDQAENVSLTDLIQSLSELSKLKDRITE